MHYKQWKNGKKVEIVKEIFGKMNVMKLNEIDVVIASVYFHFFF